MFFLSVNVTDYNYIINDSQIFNQSYISVNPICMLYFSFYILLDSICSHFVEDFGVCLQGLLFRAAFLGFSIRVMLA